MSGGETYLQFKPDLIDANDVVTDEGTRKFLKSFLDQFAVLVGKLAAPAKA